MIHYINFISLRLKVPKTRINFCDNNYYMCSIDLFNRLSADIENCEKFWSFINFLDQHFNVSYF